MSVVANKAVGHLSECTQKHGNYIRVYNFQNSILQPSLGQLVTARTPSSAPAPASTA